ncbi:MAG: Cell division protein ftsA [Candidatus Magasanikbacteria bacterium GW2011_GWC2_37_14]|uniref:Cell division protein FtsA n=1 Tax=Candidatus Magasanikbacteria bacterium GW2011_GWC2_37_14 TaxID=1619046 RepID=A0A0G0IU18_9BACT|nr:MAG: Cell division protein ftsA [Candidatus Magasanikbacteria bacterium GW2011_GWC2_37_14]
MIKRKAHVELITGLDLGSTSVRLAVAKQVFVPGEKTSFQIVGLIEVPSEGIHKGVITSIEETVSAVSHSLEKMEQLIGVPIEHAWVGISGLQIISQNSKGVVAVAKADGEITAEDLERAIEASRAVATPLNYEILHVIPRAFVVDGQTGIKDPVGMTGVRLEVDTQIIEGQTSHIKNITKAVYRTGIDIDDLVFSVLSVGDLVTTPRQRDLGAIVVNIGGATTSLIVYEEGDIIHTAVLPIGGEHVTNDLAIGLRTSIEVAERVKIECGECYPGHLNKKEMIDLKMFGAELNEEVSRKYIAEIINARMEEILEKIETELNKIGRSSLLPAGVVFTGGGAKIFGLVDLAKDKLRLPATLGYPLDILSASEKINDLSFTTAIGLVRWGASMQAGMGRGGNAGLKSVEKVSAQVKGWFKSLIP